MTNEPKVPLVSISCLSYNHENYITDALEGFLMQKTNFLFEILIHDDASTDQTAAIIKRYQKEYPDLIKPIYQIHNQWVLGKRGSVVHNFPRAKGKYIALCEGDDYWTDPLKLQRQVDFLESNPAYSMVTENGLVINTIHNQQYNFNNMEEGDIDLQSLLGKRKFPTASVLFKSNLIDDQLYRLNFAADVVLWCHFSTKGKIRYLTNVSSVYRRGLQGIIESTDKLELAKLMETLNVEISKVLPNDFDRQILRVRNYNQYKKAFLYNANQKNIKDSFLSIKKCFAYQPYSALKTLLKFIIS